MDSIIRHYQEKETDREVLYQILLVIEFILFNYER